MDRLREVLRGSDAELVDRAISLYRELLDFTTNEPDGMIVLVHGETLPFKLPQALWWLRRPLMPVFGVRRRERLRLFLRRNR